MPLVNMKDLLLDAQKGGYAVGSFSIANMEMILGVIKAAEETKSPIILQIAEVRLNHSPLHIIGPTMIAAAKGAKVPVAVHLDHGTTLECIGQALDLGFTNARLFRYAAVHPTEIKAFRSFWMLYLSSCRLRSTFRLSLALTLMVKQLYVILLMKSRSLLLHSRS